MVHQQYVKAIEQKHRHCYFMVVEKDEFSECEDLFSFMVLIKGCISRKPFIDLILENLE